MTKMVVLNGPNLNRLGKRRPERYGYSTLLDLVEGLQAVAAELAVELVHKQSNSEGELIDFLHEHMDDADAIIINPAGLTLYGRSLLDACGDARCPVAVVHIAQLYKRGDIYGPQTQDMWKEICDVYVCGLGLYGYSAALIRLAELVIGEPLPYSLVLARGDAVAPGDA